jgi:Ser/Thr protein kinase RdoA (MazF antagonist)
MEENKIIEIFKNLKINVRKIEGTTNSFNSNVYIITADEGKFVLKISNNEKKQKVESKYMTYLSKYLETAKVISTGSVLDKYYIVMTFFEGDNLKDEEADTLSDNSLKEIGILLAKLHTAPIIDEDNDSWTIYLNDCLEKTQDVLKKVFADNNEVIYTFLKKYIKEKLTNNYKNSILHMDFRIGNLMFKKHSVGLIDMESMKNGDYVFDFVKINRSLPKEKFALVLNGYEEIKPLDSNFNERLDFYSLFDSYTSLWWSVAHNRCDSDFYKMNYNIVIKYLDMLNKKGTI